MTKKLLKNIILRIRSLTGLEDPSKITYYWNESGQVEFKLFFDGLVIPKNFLPEDLKSLKAIQNSFSDIAYTEGYLDDFLIKEINPEEGFITILTDDQDFKKVSSNKEAEALGESDIIKSVVLAAGKVSKKLIENFGVIEKENRLLEDDLDDMNDELEGSQESESLGDDVQTEKQDPGAEPEKDLLIVNIPLAAWVSENDLTDLVNLLKESVNTLAGGDDGLIIKVTSTTTTGVSQAKNLEKIKRVIGQEGENQAFTEQSDTLKKTITTYKSKNRKVYTTKVPDNFNRDCLWEELKSLTQYAGAPEKLEIIDKINSHLFAIYEKSLSSLDILIDRLKQNIFPAFKSFVKDYISLYKGNVKPTDLDTEELESDTTTSESESDKT